MKGICFKEDLFRKILDGKKTQTRRPIDLGIWDPNDLTKEFVEMRLNPRYKKGEIVYLKEPWLLERKYPNAPLSHPHSKKMVPVYAYDKQPQVRKILKWKNKLFMPEQYARYFIEILEVRAERVQDITNEDAWCEGVCDSPEYNCVGYFSTKWWEIYGMSSWTKNPWVWVYKIRCTNNIAIPKT